MSVGTLRCRSLAIMDSIKTHIKLVGRICQCGVVLLRICLIVSGNIVRGDEILTDGKRLGVLYWGMRSFQHDMHI